MNYSLELLRDAVGSHPHDAQTYIRLNDIYNGLALYSDRNFLKSAESAGLKALELSPSRQDALMTLGRTYLIGEQTERAIDLGRQMVREYPDIAVPHWFLGFALLEAKQISEAKKELGIALRGGYPYQPRELETLKQLLSPADFADMGWQPPQ